MYKILPVCACPTQLPSDSRAWAFLSLTVPRCSLKGCPPGWQKGGGLGGREKGSKSHVLAQSRGSKKDERLVGEQKEAIPSSWSVLCFRNKAGPQGQHGSLGVEAGAFPHRGPALLSL